MGAIERGSLPADLERARSRFQAWRARRKRGTRIPRTLWTVAVRLAKEHGVCRAATALGLDYYSLKKRTESSATPRQSDGPAFVELAAPAMVAKQCQVELDNGAGATMRVQLIGYDAADIEALARGFWSDL
ncbi:MAG: hypothetical protein ACYC3L_15655 [Gemmatimonadaceae bacterium]